MRAAEKREEELRQQIAALKAARERDQEEYEENTTQLFWGQPFCREIDKTSIRPNFREVVVEPFDGSQDPHVNLQAFQTQIYISGGNDRLSCKLFPGTLRGVAMQWMATLPPRSIQTFKDLAGSFLSQFASNKVKRLEVADLFNIKQAEGESLKNYLARFNNATVRVDDPDQKFFVKAFQKGLRVGPFNNALALKKPVNMEEIRARAEKHVEMEEDQYGRRRSERKVERKEVRLASKAREDKRPVLARVNEQTQRFTPLTEKRAQIMHQICHTSLLEYRPEARGKLMGKRKVAAFGHTTEDCWALKTQIEKLVQNGHLDRYVQQASPRRSQLQGRDLHRPVGANRRERSRSRQRTPTHRGTITTISGGRTANSWVSSNRVTKEVEEGRPDGRVQTVLTGANTTPLGKREPTPIIAFNDRDMKGQVSCQDEPMVISVGAVGYKVERILIDQGSSSNILYRSTLERMQLPADLVQSCPGNLYGFAGECVSILGTVELETCFGEQPVSRTIPVLYTIVDAPASYNIIIGRPALNRLGAIVSTKHLCMKFSVGRRVGSVLKERDPSRRGLEKGPVGTRAGANDKNRDDHELERGGKAHRTNCDVFAWSAQDMPGVDPNFICHRLSIDEQAKPVAQKKKEARGGEERGGEARNPQVDLGRFRARGIIPNLAGYCGDGQKGER
ncbi:hypothetical protein CR513_47173, partial [Mucuna pruriens]